MLTKKKLINFSLSKLENDHRKVVKIVEMCFQRTNGTNIFKQIYRRMITFNNLEGVFVYL